MAGKQKLKTALIAFFIAIAAAAPVILRIGYSLDVMVSDALCQKESVANKKIFVIAIDDKTLAEYGNITSWGRELSAGLVRLLNKDENAKPAVITFDVIFSEKGDDAGDASFAEACREAGNVVTAMSYNFKEQPEYDENGKMTFNKYHVDGVTKPYEALKNATKQGYANTLVGSDGYVRRSMAYIDVDGERTYSLAFQTYKTYQESRGEPVEMPQLDENNQYLFAYSGKTGCYSTISLVDVMNGKVNPAMFADGIVFVGAYAVGMQDSYMPAISHGTQMYGVEIQANSMEALLEKKTQSQLPLEIYASLSAAIAVLFYLAVRRMKIIFASLFTAACMLIGPVFAKVMFGRGYITPVTQLPAIIFAVYAVHLVYGYVQEIMRRQKVVSVFKQYVAPQVVDKISRDKDFELVLGGENRHIACLFVDIRGFTTMSENLNPEEVVEILNEYLSLTTHSILKNGGTLDKFVGDATMAVFNAPFDLEDYVYKAVRTAWDMKIGADEVSKKLEERFGKKISFGIGVNCGDAVVGNIGCDFRMDYTAIGDTVNTAARLESNAKQGQILISRNVYEALGGRIEASPIGEISLKGKSQGVFVYQLDKV